MVSNEQSPALREHEPGVSSVSDDLPPERALALLGNETRLAILREIAAADPETLSFSTLQKRVGVTDSGRFNYHLNKLTDYYVHRTDEGYVLRQVGRDALEVISRL